MLLLLTGAIHKIVASETIVKKSNALPVQKRRRLKQEERLLIKWNGTGIYYKWQHDNRLCISELKGRKQKMRLLKSNQSKTANQTLHKPS